MLSAIHCFPEAICRSILHIGTDNRQPLTEWNGIFPVRDVCQADFFIWKINFVNADSFAVHIHHHANRDIVLSEKVLDGFLSTVFTGLRDKDIVALSPQSFCLGDPLIFPKTGHGDLPAAFQLFHQELCAERGRCLLRIFTVNLEVAVLGKADNRFGMGFLDGIVGGLRFKGQYAQLFYHAMLDGKLVNVILNTAGFRMEARFEALTAEDHVKLSRILRQITHRHNLAVLFFQRDRFTPVAAERQIKGGIVLKGDCHCLNRNGELLHPLHMGGIVQLNEVASDGISLYAFDLNRVGKYGIAGLLMVELPHFVFVGILDIDFTLRQEVSAVRTGHPEKVLVLGGLGSGKAVKQPGVQLKILLVVLGVDVHNPAKGIHKIDVFKLHRHHSKPTSWDFCLTGVFRSGWLFAAARSCSRIEGFSRAAS